MKIPIFLLPTWRHLSRLLKACKQSGFRPIFQPNRPQQLYHSFPVVRRPYENTEYVTHSISSRLQILLHLVKTEIWLRPNSSLHPAELFNLASINLRQVLCSKYLPGMCRMCSNKIDSQVHSSKTSNSLCMNITEIISTLVHGARYVLLFISITDRNISLRLGFIMRKQVISYEGQIDYTICEV